MKGRKVIILVNYPRMRRIKSEDVMGYSVLELGMEVTNCVVAAQLPYMHEWNTGMYSVLQVNLTYSLYLRFDVCRAK